VVTFTETVDSVSQINTKIYTRVWTATDECQNITVHQQKITVSEIIRIELARTICEGDQYELGDNSYGLTGVYNETFTSSLGCDSIVTLNLTVNPVKRTNIDAVLCQGEQVIVGGQVYTESVTNEVITLQTSTGCDSIITLNLIVLKQDTLVTDRSICAGDYAEIGGQRFTSSGTYYIPFQNNQCTGIVQLNLTVNVPTASTVTRTICEGESTTVAGQVYSTTGTYVVNTSNTQGCDSVITLNLTVTPKSNVTLDRTICIGQSVTIGANTYYASGTYNITLSNSTGCDSNITLNLVVLGNGDTTKVSQTICEGESTTVGGQTFTTAGVYYIASSNGQCSDVTELTLSVNSASAVTIKEALCSGQSIVVGNQTFSTSGTYTITLQNTTGCDSVVTLILNIFDGGSKTQVDSTICFGGSVTYAGQTFFQTGIYQIIYPTDICRDTLLLNLTVNPEIKVTIARTICEGDQYELGDNSYGLTGVYNETFTSSLGCDSIVTLNLTVNPVKRTNIDAVLCQGEQVIVGGQVYTESVTNEVITLQTSTGCDSIITLNLIVLKQDTLVTDRSICAGDYAEIGGQIFTSSGTYYIPFQNNQCTGIVQLNLTVNVPTASTVTRTICEGESTTVAGQVYSTTGTYVVNTTNAQGCDSTVTLNLTVNPITNSTIDRTICLGETVTVGTQTFNITGTYNVTLINAAGCDSNVTLNLVVLGNGDTTKVSQTICEGESTTVGGQTFTTAGVYYIASSNGQCSDVTELTLSVNSASAVTIKEALCSGQSIVVGNQTFSTSGTYTITLQNSTGCDSVVTLILNIFDGGSKTQVDSTICFGGSVTYAGQTFFQTGNISDNLSNRSLQRYVVVKLNGKS
jgi:hypothetical protein